MTEKRFVDNGIEDIENQSFTDNLTRKTYWIDNGLDEIVDMLNKLNDENEQLESELEKVVEVCRKYGIYKEELQYVLADYDKMLNENGERAIRYKYCVNSKVM